MNKKKIAFAQRLEQNSKNNSETGNYLQNSEKSNHTCEILHLLFIYAKT